jgi:hypothetical protein
MLTRRETKWAAVLRLVVLALVVPLSLSDALPVFASVLGRPPVHVCRCDSHHATCACPICHPEHRDELLFRQESIRGTCGDEDVGFGGALALSPAIPAATAVTVLPAAVGKPLASIPTAPPSDVTLDIPKPPPRVALA